jgi:hypothetical protein
MCLNLAKHPGLIKPKKPIKVYKIYGITRLSKTPEVCSQIRGSKFTLEADLVIKSDRPKLRKQWSNTKCWPLTKTEYASGQVFRGIHAYTSLKYAIQTLKEHYSPTVLVEFLGDPKDFIARGLTDWRGSEVVFDKLKVNRIVHYCSRREFKRFYKLAQVSTKGKTITV